VWFESHNQKERTAVILQMIEEANADFVCLQEITGTFLTPLVQNSFVRNNYYLSGNGIRGYGICILSKFPCFFSETKFITGMGRSLLTCETRINGNPFVVATSHLESMNSAELRKDQL
jgi:endonuclease/exonuclease/phosphatase family metal-dependent hydrolase